MSAKRARHRVSKAEWLEAGLQALSRESVAGIHVEGLARSLGIAKSGFYWHFEDRRDLIRQLVAHWSHEVTEVITKNREILALEPKARLAKTAEMILEYDLVRYELPIRQWALQDADVARATRRVNRIRLDFTRSAFSELGFKGDDLEMRSMLFVCYHTWESPMFREIPRKRRRELIARRLDLLTSR